MMDAMKRNPKELISYNLGLDLDFSKLNIRTLGSDDFIFVNRDLCIGCTRCTMICPVNIWKLRDGKASIAEDYKDRCMECGSCEICCESDAITFLMPTGGTGVHYKKG